MSKTVFILGAGASISHSQGNFPSYNEFFSKARTLNLLNDKNSYDKNLIDYINKVMKTDILSEKSQVDIERLMTFMEIEIENNADRESYQVYKKRLLEIIIMLFEELSKNLKTKKGDYNDFIENIEDNYTVITFNWDLLLDKILGGKKQYENLNDLILSEMDLITFNKPINSELLSNNGYYLKLHGSIDWLYCPNEDCGLYAKVFPIKNIYGEYWCSECSSRMKHLIIPPVLNKNYSSFPFIKKLWNIALEEIRSAEELVIWGYQLPPSDFYNRWLFRQTSDLLRTVSIIDPNCYKKDKNQNITQNKKEFLNNFLSIFKTGKKDPDMIYYEYFKDYIKGVKYADKYNKK